jgi:hypothetical protein
MLNNFIFLGDFLFQDVEIPEQINIGGAQRLYVHELLGGQRVVDVMGQSDADLSWSGWFFGELALERALYLDYLRTQGQPLTLTYSQFNYTVIIKEFSAQYQRASKLPYSITLTVVQNNTAPVTIAIPTNFNDIVNDALIEAAQLALVINNGGISADLAVINALVNAVPSLAGSSQVYLESILAAGQSLQSSISSAISATSSEIFGS